MLNQYFTFTELMEEYGFSINSRELKVQVKAALIRKIFIIPAYKKGKTYFQLCTQVETMSWLNQKSQSVNIKGYSKQELLTKYNLTTSVTSNKDFIQFMKSRGIEIIDNGQRKNILYTILNDDIFNADWQPYIKDNNFEVCREGRVRNTKSKRLCGSTNKRDGYVIINNSYNDKGQYTAHRMVKETFDPIEHEELYVVDHINGIKTDNNINNLRWCYQSQNMSFKAENYSQIKELIPKCIQKYGYKGFEEKLKALLLL